MSVRYAIPSHSDSSNRCNLLGPTGFIIQITMAALSFFVLMYKRAIENPKREWKIFLLDTSKQVFSSGTLHILNVALAMMISARRDDDSCVWYLVTIIIDCTVGTFINCGFLNLSDRAFGWLGKESFKAGNYFIQQTERRKVAPQKFSVEKSLEVYEEIIYIDIDYAAWTIQLICWCIMAITTKMIMFTIQRLTANYINVIGALILSGFTRLFFGCNWLGYSIDTHVDLKLIVVMMISPVIFNSLQLWLQDSFLKKKDFSKPKDAYTRKLFFQENPQRRRGSAVYDRRLATLSELNHDIVVNIDREYSKSPSNADRRVRMS